MMNSLSFPGSVVGGQRVDDLWHLGDPAHRNPAELAMLADGVLASCQVDAECLVARDIAVLPLHGACQFFESTIGGARCAAQFRYRHAADAGDIPFDHVTLQLGHDVCSLRLV